MILPNATTTVNPFTTAQRLEIYRETLAWYKNSPSSLFLCPALVKTALNSENKAIEKTAEVLYNSGPYGMSAGAFCIAYFLEIGSHKPKDVKPGDSWFTYQLTPGREIRTKILEQAIETCEQILNNEQTRAMAQASFLGKVKRFFNT